MKLLPVRQLNDKINQQKKNEVDAGLFLAKKVDRLREDVADEQKKHDDDIAQLNNNFRLFATEISEKKDILEKEISTLEEKKRILLIPLESKWEEVRSKDEELKSLATKLNIIKESLYEQQKKIEANERVVQRNLEQTTEEHRQAKEHREKAEETRNAREEEFFKAHQEREKATIEFENTRKKLANDQYVLDERLKGVELISKALKKKQKELTIYERRLSHRC